MNHHDDVTDAYGQLVPVTVSDLPTVGGDTDWDPATLAAWNNTDDPAFSRDLRLEHYTEQVVAALHGDPAVLTLDPATQDAIAGVGRVFEHIARHINAPWNDPDACARRAAVLLTTVPVPESFTARPGGTAARCNCEGCPREITVTDGKAPGWKAERGHTGPCLRLYALTGGEPDWQVAGREDTTCPACTAAKPKHAAKAVAQPVVKAQAKVAGTPTPKRRPRRRPAGGA